MIGSLSGVVQTQRGRALIIQTGGIGYLVEVPARLLTRFLPGSPAELAIHTHETSESTRLFGFESEDDVATFEKLLTVPGVGPKIALVVLSLERSELVKILAADDAKALSRLPGIGAKTASRIILELRGKLVSEESKDTPEESEEAVTALLALGFAKKDILARLKKRPEGMESSEEILRWYLKG